MLTPLKQKRLTDVDWIQVYPGLFSLEFGRPFFEKSRYAFPKIIALPGLPLEGTLAFSAGSRSPRSDNSMARAKPINQRNSFFVKFA